MVVFFFFSCGKLYIVLQSHHRDQWKYNSLTPFAIKMAQKQGVLSKISVVDSFVPDMNRNEYYFDKLWDHAPEPGKSVKIGTLLNFPSHPF